MRIISFKKFKKNCKWYAPDDDLHIEICDNIENDTIKKHRGNFKHFSFEHSPCMEKYCPVFRSCKNIEYYPFGNYFREKEK